VAVISNIKELIYWIFNLSSRGDRNYYDINFIEQSSNYNNSAESALGNFLFPTGSRKLRGIKMPLSPRQVCPVPSGSLYIPLILSASVRSGSVASRCNCTLGRCPSYSANPCGLCCTFDFVSEIYRYAYGCLRARVLLRNTLRPLLSLRFPSETYRPRFREL